MRIVAEIPHRDCKITIFNWNNKYLLKFEQPFFEQTYKISAFDVTGEDDVKALITSEFIEEVLKNFEEMGKSLAQAMRGI
ncbi:MAG TPA: hypothetical protein VD908_20615 [Cytophagales bacterium]|nr:hypothetical protein [Cytophagales bacterium]